MEKYKKRGGSAGSKGVKFQIDLLTLFLLKASNKLKEWRLSTENEEADKFDDIVLEWPQGSILVQAKHKLKKKPVTFDELFTSNTKHEDFSILKYFFSYGNIKKKFNVTNIIICTNTYIRTDRNTQNFLITHQVEPENLLYCQGHNCCFYSFNTGIISRLKQQLVEYCSKNRHTQDIELITDSNISEFLAHFQFFFNYPSEDELSKVIEELLSTMICSSWCKISAQDINNKVLNWFEQSRGQYLTEVCAKAMFHEIRSVKYSEILENYNVTFKQNGFNFDDNTQIFHIKTDEDRLLEVIKINNALRQSSKLLYVTPYDDLDILNNVVDAFTLPDYVFLIIVCPEITYDEKVTEDIGNKLKVLLTKYQYKKVVFIADNANKLLQRNLDFKVVKVSITFDDLSKETQDNLLGKKNIIFQGTVISLKDLFLQQHSVDYGTVIDSETMKKLVKNKMIRVGLPVEDLDKDITQHYIPRIFIRTITMDNSEVTDESFEEQEIFGVDEKVVTINDSAGMGKSTILTKLALQIKTTFPHLWVIRLDFKDYTEKLFEMRRQPGDITKLLDHKYVTRFINNLERNVFAMPEKVVLMMDGVDEISPDYTKTALSLLAQCKAGSNFAKVFVTTRPHLTRELESQLQVKSFRLEPFTRENQVDFLTSFWTYNLELTQDDTPKCRQYADALIQKMSSWLKSYKNWENHFAAIPLQTKMLAEVFQERDMLEISNDLQSQGCKEFLKVATTEPKLTNKINMVKLYEMFIEKKRKVFMKKENPYRNSVVNAALSDQFDECLAYHCSLALEVVLEESERNLFSSHKSRKGIAATSNALKIGIVQQYGNQFNFIHRTFAEYFVAQSVLMELQLGNNNVKFQKLFIDKMLQLYEFEVVCDFLDGLLQDVVDSLPANIFKSYQSLKNESYNSNLIHSLASNGHVAILQLILKCINFKSGVDKKTVYLNLFKEHFNFNNVFHNTLHYLKVQVQKHGIDIKNLFSYSPLHYATRNDQLQMIKFLITYGADVQSKNQWGLTPLESSVNLCKLETIKVLMEQVRGSGKRDPSLLHTAILRNDLEITAYLLDNLLEDNTLNLKHPVVPYTAAYLGKLDVLKHLLQEVDAELPNGESLIFGAVRGGQIDTVRYLIQRGAAIDHIDHYGNTVMLSLHELPESKIPPMLELLINHGADINKGNNSGVTALYTAALKRHQNVVEHLIAAGADINWRSKKGRTALHSAAKIGFYKSVQILVNCGADLDIRDDDGCTALHLALLETKIGLRRWLTIKFLIQHGADVNLEEPSGRAAAIFADLKDRLGLENR